MASDGGIFSFGGAPFYGSTGGIALNKPIVGMAATPDGGGYWLVASDGGIFSYGDAQFYGSTGSIRLNKPIVGMASTPDGKGYWLVASDGGIFTYGDAQFYGSTGSITLNKPVVGMAATADGQGYWLVASDGGIFSYGDAQFHGSTGSLVLNKPVIGMITGPGGSGYFLVASDGGIFSFGSAPFYGSLGGLPLKNPVVAAATTPSDNGYWFTDTAGLVSNFGSADYYGSAPSPLNRPIVGMAEAPGTTGSFTGGTYPSGAYGFDISTYQCTSFPSGLHQIGIVQVDGSSSGNTNPCLAQEAGWAGTGLNLYTYLTYGTSTTNEPGCSGDTSCNAGYQAAIYAYNDANAAGAGSTTIPWWLDVRDRERRLVRQPERERAVRDGRHQRAPRVRGHPRRRYLCQPGRVEHHRGRLHAVGPLLDGRLPGVTERPGLLRGLPELGHQPRQAAAGAARDRAVQQPAVRRGLRLLARQPSVWPAVPPPAPERPNLPATIALQLIALRVSGSSGPSSRVRTATTWASTRSASSKRSTRTRQPASRISAATVLRVSGPRLEPNAATICSR